MEVALGMSCYPGHVGEFIEGLAEPEPLWVLPGLEPGYLRGLLHEVHRAGKVAEVLQFTPGVGLAEIDADPKRLLWRAGDGSLAGWLREQHAEIQPGKPGSAEKWRLLWVYATDAVLQEAGAVMALASLCQRITVLGARCRVLLTTEAPLDGLLRPWARRVELPVPRLGARLETYVREMLQGPLGELAAERSTVEEAARKLQGLEAPGIARVMGRAIRRAGGREGLDARRKELGEQIVEGKRHTLQEVSGLDVCVIQSTANDVGGMEELKYYIEMVGCAFHDREEARKQRVDEPRGILLVGLPGCGKSLAAELTADLLDLPLLRLDVGGLMGSMLGQSEERLKQVIAAAEAAAPCVLWVDEIEKALGGLGGDRDGGTGKRMLGRLLTWMQEQKAGVYLFATANRLDALPPELLRRGRFDELWRVDLPLPHERQAILKIHLARHGLSGWSEEQLQRAASDEVMKEYTGADISSLVREAHLRAFAAKKTAVTLEDLKAVAKDLLPLSRQFADQIGDMRKQLERYGFRDVSSKAGAAEKPRLERVRPRRLVPELRRLIDGPPTRWTGGEKGEEWVLGFEGNGSDRVEMYKYADRKIVSESIKFKIQILRDYISISGIGLIVRFDGNNYIDNKYKIINKYNKETHEAKGVRFDMAYCPAGRFTMGSPKNEEGRDADEDQQEVEIARPFWIGVHPVTQGLYQAITGQNPSEFKGKPDSALRPVENVSWLDAVRFCNKLSEVRGLSPAYVVGEGETPTVKWNPKASGFRLLEEAEWEYATRAGQPFRFSGSDRLEEVGWFDGNSKGETHAVGGLKANAWGIHDMSGNVWEWCWNGYDSVYKSSYELVFSINGTRVYRGGGWSTSMRLARVATRRGWPPSIRRSFLGFRLARLQ